jgi:hypothetical protein
MRWLPVSDPRQSSNDGDGERDRIRDHVLEMVAKLKARIDRARMEREGGSGSVKTETDPEDDGT